MLNKKILAYHSGRINIIAPIALLRDPLVHSAEQTVSCCGARKNLRAYASPRFFRPLPLAHLASSATGSARLAPPLETRLHYLCYAKIIKVRLGQALAANSPPDCRIQFFESPREAKKQIPHRGICFFGDPLETRTPDPLLKRQLLYRLS